MNNRQLNIAICGATGRMGEAVIDALNIKYKQYKVSGRLSSNSSDAEREQAFKNSDVVIDFSLPSATDKILESAIANKTPLLICTTGLTASQLQSIEKAGEDIPILYAPNTSLGANLLMEISGKIAAILKEYDVEIIDTHHKHKKDSPSGTAIAIGKSVAASRGDEYSEVVKIGRFGESLRAPGEIGISSLRCGGVYGRHDVSFANDDEIITVSHQSLSRNVFAEGAIKVAIWLAEKPRGVYHMVDVIELT